MKKVANETIFAIPEEVASVAKALENKGFEAFLVGGCTRDTLIGRKPADWDITTNATPDDIISIFPKTFYENEYGTVGIVNESTEDETLKIVEVTPYRLETSYSDKRRPDSVTFSKSLGDDLKRRDFTINAIALRLGAETDKNHYAVQITDLYDGLADLKRGLIKTVGNPEERFGEDALRIIRAVRIGVELGFSIEEKTKEAIIKSAVHLKMIAKERIQQEFIRIVMSDRPMEGFQLLKNLEILKFIAPELETGIGVGQNKAHSYDVWEHTMRSVQHSALKKYPLDVRLATLFHDIGKPSTRLWSEEKKDWTFHGHDVVGAKIATKILANLKFSKKDSDKIVKLVRWHMFFSDTEQITLSAVRRLVSKVGPENIWDLMSVRMCDRIGTGRPKESPYRLRKYQSMVEEVMRNPISVAMLKIDGHKIMEVTRIQPGPKIGQIFNVILEEVIEKPELNSAEILENRALELAKMDDKALKALSDKGKERMEAEEKKEIEQIRKKYWVK